MNYKTYCGVSALLFTVVALVHLTRLIYGWPVQVDSAAVPMLVSWMGLAVSGGLAVWGYRGFRAVT